MNLTATSTSDHIISLIVTAVMLAVMFLLPALIVLLTKKIKFLSMIGALALCYFTGFLISLIPIPYDKGLTQTVASVLVAIAIPLILFGIRLADVKKLAKKTVLSFGLVIVATVIVSAVAFLVADRCGLSYADQLAGMATGLYIGGTPNLVAVGNALIPADAVQEVIAAANTSDFFVGGIYFLLLLTVVPKLYRKLLDRSLPKTTKDQSAPESAPAAQAEYDFRQIPRDKKSLLRLIGVVALAVVCLGVGAGLELLTNGSLEGSLYIMVAVSVLGVAVSLIRPVRETKGSYQIGQYLLLIFSMGLSMSIDLKLLVKEILPILAFFACVQVGCIVVHLILCKIFRIDSGTAIITGTAGIYGPPFIAPVANSYGDRSLIAPGIICGTVGLAIGNFVGLGMGLLLGLI